MYFILAALVALAAYVGMLAVEARRGARFFAGTRARLDRAAVQAAFIIEHVDFASFVREEALRAAQRVTHVALTRALESVRAAEHALARLVRHLRLHGEVGPALGLPSRESARPFVRTLSEFKGHLEATRPKMPEIR